MTLDEAIDLADHLHAAARGKSRAAVYDPTTANEEVMRQVGRDLYDLVIDHLTARGYRAFLLKKDKGC